MVAIRFPSRTGTPRSLEARLWLRLGGLMLGIVFFGGLAFSWYAYNALPLSDQEVRSHAEAIAARLQANSPASMAVAARAIWSQEHLSDYAGGQMMLVVGPDGRIPFASSEDARRLLEPLVDAHRGDASQRLAGRFFLAPQVDASVACRGFAAPAGEFLVVLAEGCANSGQLLDWIQEELLEFGGWWVIPVALLSTAIVIFTIRGSFAPLRRLSAAAARIGPDATDIRLSDPELPEEVRPLVDAFNRALDRLEEGFELQRRFTADAAHELRTPLAVLTARLDQAPTSVDIDGLQRDVQTMSRIVEQLLRVARLDADILDVGQPIDLRGVAVDAVTRLAPLAIADGREIALIGDDRPAMVFGNAAALTTAVVNLIENALAQAPRGSVVEVAVSDTGRLTVSDSGPGIPPELRDVAFQRFWRGRDNRAVGAGLGLAIVAETVRAHSGTVSVSSNSRAHPGPGARVEITLPVAEASLVSSGAKMPVA